MNVIINHVKLCPPGKFSSKLGLQKGKKLDQWPTPIMSSSNFPNLLSFILLLPLYYFVSYFQCYLFLFLFKFIIHFCLFSVFFLLFFLLFIFCLIFSSLSFSFSSSSKLFFSTLINPSYFLPPLPILYLFSYFSSLSFLVFFLPYLSFKL